MEETAILLVNSLNDAVRCEIIIESYCSKYFSLTSRQDVIYPRLLEVFLNHLDHSYFKRLFHVSKDTVYQIVSTIKGTKTFRTSVLTDYHEDDIITFACTSILYINSCLSIRACSMFSGLSINTVESHVNIFNKIMNEIKDEVIRFPALSSQELLEVDSKRCFPGAVGVVGNCSIYLFICRFCFYSKTLFQ